LQNALLDASTIEQLFRDVELCTEVREIIPKFAAQGYVSEKSITLAQARDWLFDGQVRAVQLRYRYEGADWWDTIMSAQGSYRLVRIRHEFPQ